MSDARLSNALRRIAAAMERIEAVALSPAPQAPAPETDGSEASNENEAKLAELTARHAKLKEETTIALSALDAVIARASAGSRN